MNVDGALRPWFKWLGTGGTLGARPVPGLGPKMVWLSEASTGTVPEFSSGAGNWDGNVASWHSCQYGKFNGLRS